MDTKGMTDSRRTIVGLLIAACGLLFMAPRGSAAGQATYGITDLGTLGGNNSVPIWVTNSGDVVGFSDTGQFDSSGFPIDHAFRWRKGVMQNLGTLGGSYSSAFGANNEGQVAGVADVTGGAASHAALWYKGTVTDLGTLTGTSGYSQAQLVNSAHQVAGFSFLADGSGRAVLWDRGAMTDLGTLGGPNSFANGLNDLGQVVGISQVNDVSNPILGFPPFYGVLWDKGNLVNLCPGRNGVIGCAAFNINNKSQVVGRFATPDPVEGAVAHAFLWQSGHFQDLGIPAGFGDDNSEAISLNDSGQIVGDSGVGFIETYSQNHALLWQKGDGEARLEAGEGVVAGGDDGRQGRWIDLNTLIPPDSGYHLIVAFDVNARGQIVVCAVQQSTGNIHAALLTPQPSNVGSRSDILAAAVSDAASPLSEDARRLLAHARRSKFAR
jgi:probable HAF family extracellular repeat protein